MAFAQKNLTCVGSGGDNSLFMYTTTDADTVVETSDYFLDAYAQLRVGDFILANLYTGDTRETKIYYVTASASTGVDIGFPTIT
jgi:hypothetical protein